MRCIFCTTFNRGSGLARRRRDREVEIEADERDRQHELEEIEEIRKRLVDQQTEEVRTFS